MSNSSGSNVKKIVAYVLAAMVLLFSVAAILVIWDIIEYKYLIRRMFQSLMVVLASSAVIVLIFSILDRPDRVE